MEAKKSFRDALCIPKVPKIVQKVPKIVVEEPKIVVVEEPKIVVEEEFTYESIEVGEYYVVKKTDDDDWQKEVNFLMKCTDKKDGDIYYSININPHCMWPGVVYSPVYSSTKFSDGKITPLPVNYWTNKSKYNIKQYYWVDDDDF